MNNIPNLNNLINAIKCDGIYRNQCEQCPYDYQFWDDSGDYGMWWCDENRLWADALFYLRLYQHLIKEDKNE